MTKAPHIRMILWKAAKTVDRIDRASIAETGLHVSDFAILEVLLHKGALPISVIGEKVLLTSGSMTAAVNRLQRKGLVRRLQDPGDGRVYHIHLTVAGRKEIEKAYTAHVKNLEEITAVLTDREQHELERMLKKLGRHAETMGCPA